MPLLTFERVSIDRGGRTIVRGVDLTVGEGQFVAVLGPNGSGKSSLLKAALGLLRPSAGTVTVHAGGPAAVGYVPQQRPLPENIPLRGRDFVSFGLDGSIWGPRRAKDTGRVEEALAMFDALDLADARVQELSGGQQQRLRLAQALAGRPRLLLCDEPLLSLDLPTQQLVAAALDRYRRESGAAVVFVTHELNPVAGHVDLVTYLAQGRAAVGAPEEIMTTESLTRLYGSPVTVLRHQGRFLVIGGSAHEHHCDGSEMDLPRSAALTSPLKGRAG